MSWYEITVLFLTGLFAGFVNTLAGGGSIVSFSILLMFGLPPSIANGTNRINVLTQTFIASSSFKFQKVLDTKKALWLGVPALFGSVAGAWIAIDINEKVFERVVGVILLVMLVFILYKPELWLKERKDLVNAKVTWKQILIFFLIGVYGGFIQIGVGFFLMAGIVLSAGYELVKANAIKSFIVFLYTPVALIVFILNNQINWAYGLMIALGTIAGAYFAARMAVKKGAKFLKWVIIVIILITSADLFGIIDIKGIVSLLN